MAMEPGPGDGVEDSWGLGGDSLTVKTGLELGGFQVKATSSSRKLPRNGLHFGRGSSFSEKLDKPVVGHSKCLPVSICG